jgi:hypothetical protein
MSVSDVRTCRAAISTLGHGSLRRSYTSATDNIIRFPYLNPYAELAFLQIFGGNKLFDKTKATNWFSVPYTRNCVARTDCMTVDIKIQPWIIILSIGINIRWIGPIWQPWFFDISRLALLFDNSHKQIPMGSSDNGRILKNVTIYYSTYYSYTISCFFPPFTWKSPCQTAVLRWLPSCSKQVLSELYKQNLLLQFITITLVSFSIMLSFLGLVYTSIY